MLAIRNESGHRIEKGDTYTFLPSILLRQASGVNPSLHREREQDLDRAILQSPLGLEYMDVNVGEGDERCEVGKGAGPLL